MIKIPVIVFLCIGLSIGAVMALPAATSPSIIKGTKDVTCAPTELIFKVLTGEEFSESPLWIGSEESSTDRYVMFVNNKTRTWTMVQVGSDQACILGLGENHILASEFDPITKPSTPSKPVPPVKPVTPTPPPTQNSLTTDKIA